MYKSKFLLGLALLLSLATAGTALVAQTTPSARPATPAAGAPAQATAAGAGAVTTPKQEWGRSVGDDYFLANYQQLLAYWKKLEKESNRIHVVEIGKTAENRSQVMAIITSPANYARLDRYKEISRRLSLAEGLTDDQARALAKEGKSVVWIDGGLHATEVLGAQQLLEMVYQMVSRTDEETMRFLNDVILLCTPVNPDGMDLVSDQYMKHGNMNIPVLYNHYAGHDDNRDSYMNALPETTNISKVMFREWFPQIMYNHHQTGPAGTVMFAPPFRDPFNYNFHPMIPAGMDLIGSVMGTRFIEEGKPGVTMRRGSSYSTWWNGGLRTVSYFHNQLGILTETIGNPTPTQIPFIASKSIGDSNMWWPIPPQQVWHFRQSIEYSITANRAVLDFASRYRETNLMRIYQMGRDMIKWGSEDHWTFTPHETAKVEMATCGTSTLPTVATPGGGGRGNAVGAAGGGGGRGGNACPGLYAALTTKERRDPRGFIISSSQGDFGSAIRFANALIKSGITVQRATAPFTVNGKQYPTHSLVVKTAQAFRAHVMDMFEPQDHPDDIPYPGAAPTPPYDNAGYTLAMQMGVEFDSVLDGFDGPFEKLTDFAKPPAGTIKTAQSPVGYYFSHKTNDSFIVINRLLRAKEEVSWLWNGPMGYGTFYVTSKPTTLAILQKAATDLGVSFEATPTAPAGPSAKLRTPRIGLVDRYGGGMPVGWTRLIFKNFEMPYLEDEDDVFPPDINAGNLRSKFDVLIFNNENLGLGGGGGRGGGGGGFAPPAGGDAPAAGGATAAGAGRGAGAAASPVAAGGGAGTGQAGATGGQAAGGGRGGRGGAPAVKDPADTRPDPLPIPEKYARRQGTINAQGVEALKAFVNEGGTIIAIGSSANQAIQAFGLPLTSQITVGRTEYYVPGSILRMALDPKNPVAHGYGDAVDIFFDNNPVWKLGAASPNLRSVGWFPNAEPLRSGWAWGQKYLDKGIVMAEATIGTGRVFLFGNELLFRSQPHGTYKFFFNALYLSVAPEMKAGAGQ